MRATEYSVGPSQCSKKRDSEPLGERKVLIATVPVTLSLKQWGSSQGAKSGEQKTFQARTIVS